MSTCPSATAYEEEGATTVNDGSTAVGDTTIVVTDGTQLNVGDIISFSTTAATNDYDDGHQYRITNISTHTLTIVQKDSGSGGFNNNNKWCKCKKKMEILRFSRYWWYFTFVSGVQGSGDEIHVVVVDEDGDVTGVLVKF